MNKFRTFFVGGVKVKISGNDSYRFLRLCNANHIALEQLKAIDDGWEFIVPYRNKEAVFLFQNKCHVKAVLIAEFGLPFFLRKLKKRYFYMIGCFLAFMVWYLSSRILWTIELDGNSKISDASILRFLREQNISIGTRISGIETEEIEQSMREVFPEINWVSIGIHNTNLQVHMTENKTRRYNNRTTSIMDLIAPCDCKVENMIIRNGTAMVKPGDEVTAGTILVKGEVDIYNDDGTIRERCNCVADADIMVSYSLNVLESLSTIKVEKQYTGRERTVWKWYFLQNETKETSQSNYQYYDQISQPTRIGKLLEKWVPQMVFREVIQREYMPVERKVTTEKKEQAMNEKIQLIIQSLKEKGVQIIEKNGTMREDENLWVYEGSWKVSELLSGDLPVIEENK